MKRLFQVEYLVSRFGERSSHTDLVIMDCDSTPTPAGIWKAFVQSRNLVDGDDAVVPRARKTSRRDAVVSRQRILEVDGHGGIVAEIA